MGGIVMMKLRADACDAIRAYCDSLNNEAWNVIEVLVNCLDEEQLQNVPKMLVGEEV